jgi:hypothetical protein
MRVSRLGSYGTMEFMDASQVTALRELLSTTGWPERTQDFARSLRASARLPGSLLLFGPAGEEPWHLAAHLDDESRLNSVPEISPTLVRWDPPPDAPPHLRFGLDRLREVRRGESLLVVSEEAAPEGLLERVDDARKVGATIFALDGDDRELRGLAHESLTVPAGDSLVSFDTAQHLVSAAAGDPRARRGLRDRLAGLLDTITGPPAG